MDARSPLTTVTLLGVVAALIASLFGVPAADAPAAPPPAGARAAPGGTSPAPPQQEPAAGKARQLVQAFFGCDRDGLERALAGWSLDVLIATVPDPLASKLDWAFDQHLDALRRAHEGAGCVVDAFVLPWQAGAGAAEQAAAAEQPGVMLFRHASARALRLLFLVGEVPTRGIHKQAFAAALQEVDELLAVGRRDGAGGRGPLRVVGPAFSGSAPSLRRVLDAWLAGDPARAVEVVSGSATSPANTEVLGRTDGETVRIRFGATVHTDDTLFACLAEDVLPRLGFARDEIAILQESSTVYGASMAAEQAAAAAAGGEPKYLILPFPMNISDLRSAYARTWTAGQATAGKQPFELDFENRDHPGELPRPLSKLSPAAADLMLAEACRVLAEQRIRMVVLFATDVRDKLFLGREIAKRLPDVQLVTTEANLLHVRTELAEAQRGMLVLSTYPMLGTAATWQPSAPDTRQRLVFASDGAQGVYNAALVQLGLPGAVVDYAPPDAGRVGPTRPPVWVTCVGKTRVLPVAMHEPRCAMARHPLALEPNERATAEGAPQVSLMALLLTVTLGVAILCFSASTLVDWRWRFGHHPVLLIGTRNTGRPEHDFADLLQVAYMLHSEIYRSIQITVLTGLFLPHAALLWIVASGADENAAGKWIHVAVAAVLTVAGTLVAVIGWWRVVRIAARYAWRGLAFVPGGGGLVSRLQWWAEIALRTSIAVIGVACLGGWVVYSIAAARLAGDPQHAAPFFQRVVLLEEAVSPLLPLFLIGIGMVLWCAWHRRRARLLQQRIPLEAGEAPPPGMFGAERTAAAVRLSLTHAVPDVRGFVLGTALLVVAAWLFGQLDRTLEWLVRGDSAMGRAFDTLFFPGLLGLLMATGWAAYRLVVVWRHVDALLALHAGSRATAACTRVVSDHGVAMSLGLWLPVPRTDVQVAVARAWRRLAEAGAGLAATGLPVAADVASLQLLLQVPGSPTPCARARLVECLRPVMTPAEALDDRVLGSPAPASPSAQLRTWLDAAHDVMALELVTWVRWTQSHVRTLAFFLVLSLLLTTVLLWSYPFHPQQLLRGAFLVVSVGVLIALTTVITAMNRNVVLSSLARSTPGQITWDRSFVTNVLTFSLVPALTMVSAQIPAVGTSFLAWLEPLFHALKPSG